MNTEGNAAVDITPAAKPQKLKVPKLTFSADYSFELPSIEKALEKMRSDMGRFRTLALKHGLSKGVRDMTGQRHDIVTSAMGAKLKSAGLITTREAQDIVAFEKAISALETIVAYDTRKAAEAAKLNK